jgi:hypothetical protein
MIGAIKKWITKVAQEAVKPVFGVPNPVVNGSPVMQIYKITNGYIFYRQSGDNYRDVPPSVVYCKTPLEVAKHIVNGEVLEKMGIDSAPTQPKVTII